MGKTSDFKDLKVWQASMDLTIEVYKILKLFPPHEKMALQNQIQRCVVSIPSNIAEGHGRDSYKEFCRFLSIARGSLCELETQLIISFHLKYINKYQLDTILQRIKNIGSMIKSLSQYLNNLQNK